MAKQKVWRIHFYKKPEGAQIGPQSVFETIEGYKKHATEWAKSIAKERGWRYLDIEEQAE